MDNALCSLYHRAPGWPLSFGDEQRSRGFCLRAVEKDRRSWEAHLVLAEQARSSGDLRSLREHLDAILRGPLDERQPRVHARYREQARELRR